MNHVLDSESWVERIINRMLWKIGFRYDWYEKRYQKRMSRDPFILFYTASIFLRVPEKIEYVTMPLYCYSPHTWKWRRRLIKDDRGEFVIRLGYFRAMAITMKYAKTWL